MRLCHATVAHQRRFPVRYRFSYRVFSVLLDIDRLREQAAERRLFSHNRLNLLSFHDSDHGPRDGSALRPWVEDVLARHASIDARELSIRLLCFPRVIGYGFNPISLWFCARADGALMAVICEVHNTFGESHSYVLHGAGDPMQDTVRGEKEKTLHVSPFIAMDARYRFRLRSDDDGVSLVISETQNGRALLSATYAGRFGPADDAALARSALAVPLLGVKIMAAIHWQALLIWLRGAPFFRKPPPPIGDVS